MAKRMSADPPTAPAKSMATAVSIPVDASNWGKLKLTPKFAFQFKDAAELDPRLPPTLVPSENV